MVSVPLLKAASCVWGCGVSSCDGSFFLQTDAVCLAVGHHANDGQVPTVATSSTWNSPGSSNRNKNISTKTDWDDLIQPNDFSSQSLEGLLN